MVSVRQSQLLTLAPSISQMQMSNMYQQNVHTGHVNKFVITDIANVPVTICSE